MSSYFDSAVCLELRCEESELKGCAESSNDPHSLNQFNKIGSFITFQNIYVWPQCWTTLAFAFNLFHLYRALLQFHRRTHFTDKKMNDREKSLQNKSCVATKSTLGR